MSYPGLVTLPADTVLATLWTLCLLPISYQHSQSASCMLDVIHRLPAEAEIVTTIQQTAAAIKLLPSGIVEGNNTPKHIMARQPYLEQSASCMPDALNHLLAEAGRAVIAQLTLEGLIRLEGADQGLIQHI